MACSSGTSSGSSSLLLGKSGSEEELQWAMERRREKRKLSNRESARRSRQRKQKHIDQLMDQAECLGKQNAEIVHALGVTTRSLLAVEAQNAVLRARALELGSRLQALNEIIYCIACGGGGGGGGGGGLFFDETPNPLTVMHRQQQQQPIMASADMFMY